MKKFLHSIMITLIFNCVFYKVENFKKYIKSMRKRFQNVMHLNVRRLQILNWYIYDIFVFEVITQIDIKHSNIFKRLLKKIQKHEYDSQLFTIMKFKYVQNEKRSERFVKCDSAKIEIILAINMHSSFNLLYIFAHKLNTNWQKYSRDVCRNHKI